MKIDFTEEEIKLLVAMIAQTLEAMDEVKKDCKKDENFKTLGMALVGLSLKILYANDEMKKKKDEAVDAELL